MRCAVKWRPAFGLKALMVLTAVDMLIALVVRLQALRDFIAGDRDWLHLLAVSGLAVIVLAVLAMWATWREVRSLWVRISDADGRLDAVAVTSHDWHWQATPDLVATYCSPATADMIGYEPHELVGRTWLDLLHPDDVRPARRLLEECHRTGIGWNDVDLRWRHRNGGIVLLQESGVPVLDAEGSIVGFRGSRRVAREDAAARRELAAARRRVKAVLSEGALDVAFQPIVDLTRGAWTGVEALSRFRDGRSPDVWFAEAEAVGLGPELELLALESALTARRELPRHISVSINASPALIVTPAFTSTVSGHVLASGGLVIEVTEHAQVTDYEAVNDALRPLRDRGLRVAVDDTGAGYASFSHVLRLRPDVIKIDRSLLTRVHLDAARRSLVTAIVLLALELDATVVAEGVEDVDELRAVVDLGCDFVQGYYLARPDTSADVWRGWADTDWSARVDAVAVAAPV